MNLLIIDDKFYADSYKARLQDKFPEVNIITVNSTDDAWEHIETADAIFTYGYSLSDDLVQKATQLKWVQAQTTGVNGIVERPYLKDDIIVTNTTGIHAAPVSELALLFMLSLNRKFPGHLANQQNKIWERWPGSILDLKTVGILGVGSITLTLARICKACGMTVLGFSSTPREVENIDRMYSREDLVRIAPELDYLTIMAPITKETRNLVDAEIFAAMKPTAFLINVGRGGVVDEDAMIAALQAGEIAGAGLDTFADEPLPPDSPLWHMENVIVTPHVGGRYDVIVDYKVPIFEENLRKFLAGDFANMKNIVDRQDYI